MGQSKYIDSLTQLGDELMPKGRGRGGASPEYFDRLSDDKVLIAREDNVLMFK